MTQRRSHESHGSSWEDDKVKLTKGFKLIMDAKTPDVFDGKNRAQYLPWKVALQSEVSHLPLAPIQWLELLKARTKGDAREAVDRAYKILYEAGPDHTLDAAWTYLEHFMTPQKPSQEIVANLQQGPKISSSSPKELTALAQTCSSAVILMKCTPGALPSLNDLVTQKLIADRLPSQLRHEWYQHKCKTLRQEGAVPFGKLADWIEEQAAIARCETADTPALTAATVPIQNTSRISNAASSQSASRRPHSNDSHDTSQATRAFCKHCQTEGHQLRNCDIFAQLDVQVQRQIIYGLCWLCLERSSHEFKKCPEKDSASHRCGCGTNHNSAIKCAAVARGQFPSASRGGRPSNYNRAA